MNQKKANQAKRIEAEKEADRYYEEFNDLLMQTYAVRKHGAMWENLKILDKDNPDYKNVKDYELDSSIIQSSICDSIILIGNAALSLLNYGGEKRTLYFKTAIIFYETIKAPEHVYEIAMKALTKSYDQKYFNEVANKYEGIKNIDRDVIFHIDDLLDDLNKLVA